MWREILDSTGSFGTSGRRRPVRHCAAVLCLALWLPGGVSAPAQADSSRQQFSSAMPGYHFQFPKDHGAHPTFRTEWWYYTGHLEAGDGRQFGYELTFFRRAIPENDVKTLPSRWSITQLYLGHFAVTDVGRQRFHFSEKVSRAGLEKAGAAESQFRVWIDGWHVTGSSEDGQRQTLAAKDDHYALSLNLEPIKPVVIHGHDGISRKGPEAGQASHYYSFTRLATTGRLTVGSDSFDVTGTSWMDHEFGSADLGPDLVGWDWFSIQLTDRSEVMLYGLRRRDGSSDPVSSGTLVSPDGQTRSLRPEDFTIEITGSWTSPTSRAVYPNQWRITIPSLDLILDVTPLVADQELRTTRSTQVTYWEGAVAVAGTQQGRSIMGEGYVELTGYDKRIMNKL
jgi:predicted secreted hydrolase